MKPTTLFIIILLMISNNTFSQSKNFPDWAKGVVWYQIFPERFADGDYNNNPKADKVFVNENKIPDGWQITKWNSNWFEQSEWEKKLGGNLRDHLTSRRYGGDIQGIINNLDYLKDLGVQAIYLNPIFEAVSMHKYDGSTFHHIDINFGSDPDGDKKIIEREIPNDPLTWEWTSADKLFLKLINEVHKRKMFIVIDGVFNHTGVQFWAFQDIINNGKSSKYSEWYQIKSFDNQETEKNEFDYKGWWDIKSLPEFNRTKDDLNANVKKYIFNSTKRWMDPNNDGNGEDGIDGWRLDVAREVPSGFWHDWSRLVKDINNKAIIIGELWELSPDFISENGSFDALMNYNFAFAINDYFIAQKKKIKTLDFINRLKKIDETYPAQNLHILQNLIGSHDTERLSSMIANPDRKFDTDCNEKNSTYNPAKPTSEIYEIQKLIFAFQSTYRGAPMIYYGDEVGMWGADDPHDRKPMVWNYINYDNEIINELTGFKNGFGTYKVKQNLDLLNFYKKMISIRNKSEALKYGGVNFIFSDDWKQSFAFSRNYKDENVVIIFNSSNENQNISFKLSAKSVKNLMNKKLLSIDNSLLNIKLKPHSFEIFSY